MSNAPINRIVAVALNPAIDRVLEVPGLAIGAHQVARLLARDPAGKGVNVAKALSLLGVPCTLAGLVGQGESDYFAAGATHYNIEMAMVRVAGQTRENITLVDPLARRETHIRDQGFVVAGEELDRMRAKLAELARDGTVFVFSGSLPRGIGAGEFADLLAICRKGGARLAVDASGAGLAAAVDVQPWLIKPNREELEDLLGRKLHGEEDLLAAGREMARKVGRVLVSDGAEGAYLLVGSQAWHGSCEVPQGRLASTVGCGDALLSGFLAGCYKGLDMPQALVLAVQAAAATAMSVTALFDPADVQALAGLPAVRRLSEY
jgi:1-phosphofructokinase family hexose kinase